MDRLLILALILAYLLLLLTVARRGDRPRPRLERPAARGAIYTLSLAVLCSSWTYFGAVGLAVQGSWLFVANSLGPILAITLFGTLWRRIALLSKAENIGSVADFVSSRYGKSRTLASLVACIAIVGALPYISLQFLSMNKAWAFAAGGGEPSPIVVPALALVLAAFAILFGARRPSLTQHSRGLTRMVAFESLVKLTALLSVGMLALVLLIGFVPAGGPMPAAAPPVSDASLVTATFLCLTTVFTLPRQFHVGFVALENVEDVRTARWLFPAYMTIWTLAVIPIAMAAHAGFGIAGADPDMAVLGLPMADGNPLLLGFALVGGFSAASAMIVIETIALSSMVSNELILPWLARTRWHADVSEASRAIVTVRRATIVAILGLAWAYYLALHGHDIPTLGFTSLAASAQLFPAVLGAVLWRRGHAQGAIGGILGGMAIWFYTIAGPQLLPEVGGWSWLTVRAWTGDTGSMLDYGVATSIAVNVSLYVGLSLRARPRPIDRVQADVFVSNAAAGTPTAHPELATTLGELKRLVAQFVGPAEAERAFSEFLSNQRLARDEAGPATPALARAAERILAGAIGAPSARAMILLCLATGGRETSEIDRLLDETAHAVQFSRELLQRTLNSLDQAVCVVDSELRLIAWNSRYNDLFGLDGRRLHVGVLWQELARADASFADHHRVVAAITEGMRDHRTQSLECSGPNGAILRVAGTPLPGGEYVTSFTDITAARTAAMRMEQLNEELEDRVADRTHELTEANAALGEATMRAEQATRAQRRFVAAASHDLLQPMHAARLFVASALEEPALDEDTRELLASADVSINAADRLLRALMHLSKLELGAAEVELQRVDANALLDMLRREFEPLAQGRGLRLAALPTPSWVRSDPDLLRSVLQNLISNALRYTQRGSVLICCRREGARIRFEVRDSGPGIARESIRQIFDEFARLPGGQAAGPGAGLGLAIAERICHALGHELRVRSEPGRGSTFSITVDAAPPVKARRRSGPRSANLAAMRVLCIDDEPDVLRGMRALIERSGATVEAAASADEALSMDGEWDVTFADFHLGPGPTGLDALHALGARAGAGVLVTANAEETVASEAATRGVALMRKPVGPDALQALLARIGRTRAEAPRR